MKFSNALPASLTVFVSLVPSNVVAWGAAGHQITATIAQMLLTDRTRGQLCHVLPATAHCHLAPIASWADQIRMVPEYRGWSAGMHYANANNDWPSTHCEFGESGWHDAERNVLNAINNYTMRVEESEGHDRDIALRFLVHFVGDIHQPLHLAGRERGGNGIKVKFDHRQTSLHGLWDTGFITKRIREVHNYTHPVPEKRIESALRGAIYDPYVRWIAKEGLLGWWKDEYLSWSQCPEAAPESVEKKADSPQQPLLRMQRDLPSSAIAGPRDDSSLPVCPNHWAKPLHQLNCDVVFPPQLDAPNPGDKHIVARTFDRLVRWTGLVQPPLIELDTPEYAGKILDHKLIEKLLAMGGVRLAAVLNDIFDPGHSAQDLVW